MLKCWKKRENGIKLWDDWRHGFNYYSLVIKLDGKTTEEVRTYAEYGGLYTSFELFVEPFALTEAYPNPKD